VLQGCLARCCHEPATLIDSFIDVMLRAYLEGRERFYRMIVVMWRAMLKPSAPMAPRLVQLLLVCAKRVLVIG
jgi:hypothetical protein